MINMLFIILTGFLVRADGWATENPRWQWAEKFFNAPSCSVLFALVCFAFVDWLTALACGLAFVIWRAPGFNCWECPLSMFWRGWWTSAIGFSAISLAAHSHPSLGLLSLPFSAIYATIYSGGYKWLPLEIAGFSRHVWIEHASGWAFGLFVLIIMSA